VRPLARLLIGRPWGPLTEGDAHGERHTTALGRKNPYDVVPGLVTDGDNEPNQRGMYRRWAELMDAQSWDEIPPKRAKRGASNGGAWRHGR
jgi:hypothetical protein